MESPFNKRAGSNRINHPWFYVFLLLLVGISGYFLASTGITGAVILMLLPLIFSFLVWVIQTPRTGLYAYLVMAFMVGGISKYIGGIPLGLSLDVLLVLTFIALVLKNFYQGTDWRPLNNPLFWAIFAWFIFIFLELFNPETHSTKAWFYAMRSVAFYPFITVLLALLLLNKKKHLRMYLNIWAFFSIFSAIKAMQQKFIGVDPFEQLWLDEGAHVTHILFGKLRAFGWYSDAGTFGAAMGLALIVFGAVAIDTPKRNMKILYFTASFTALIGLLLSGTRGALVVPIAGTLVYLLLKKNIKLLIAGILAIILAFAFLKYTTIGNSIYEINRMRTALDPNNKSLQVRLENQEKIAHYLKSRPFGAGVGASGNWGLRFSPNTYLAQIPTDSWYVKIWADTGIVGLSIHILMLVFFLIAGSRIIFIYVKNRELNGILAGFMGGYFGIMVASYGNQIFGQLPINQTIFIGLAFVFSSRKLQQQYEDNTSDKETHN